jgi:hypothetical protein
LTIGVIVASRSDSQSLMGLSIILSITITQDTRLGPLPLSLLLLPDPLTLPLRLCAVAPRRRVHRRTLRVVPTTLRGLLRQGEGRRARLGPGLTPFMGGTLCPFLQGVLGVAPRLGLHLVYRGSSTPQRGGFSGLGVH